MKKSTGSFIQPWVLVALISGILSGCAELIEPDDSVDGNDTFDTAQIIESATASIQAFVETPLDTDYYRIVVDSARIITVSLSVPSLRNYDIELISQSRMILSRSAKPAGQTEWIDMKLTAAGHVFVKIWGEGGSFDARQPYLLTMALSDTAAGVYSVHMITGNPSQAENNVNMPENFLMVRPQYALSYNNALGTCNWVSWQLNSSWLGSVTRQDDFRADPDLPSGWKVVNQNEYSGSGYDRGHMCPSGDRTLTKYDNSSTFLMTNMIPQAPENNQGPWADLESYCRTLVSQGRELYVISGGYGSEGFISNGRINVPAHTWKIIVVMDVPGIGTRGINANTRIISVILPNQKSIAYSDWRTYRVSVDEIEEATGFDFMSVISGDLQDVLESRVDNLP